MCSAFHFLTEKKFMTVLILAFVGSAGYFASKYNFKTNTLLNSLLYNFGKTQSLLNITDFHFIHNPKQICSQRFSKLDKKTLLSVIHSSRGNFVSRQIIRKTHGSIITYADWHVQVVFAIGMGSETEDEMIEDLLENESIKYGDIIMGNFEDTYRNLTYKHLMGYKWASEFCPEANYYIKSDDDVIVNIFHAIDFLSSNRGSTTYKDYYCYVYTETVPMRNCDCKWEITHEEYTPEIYPDYCGYGVYIIGMETIRKILQVSSKATFLWVDDVFVSGVLRELVNKEEILTNKINIVPGLAYYNGLDKENITQVIMEKNSLGFIEEVRFPSISCSIWNAILIAYNVENIYVSMCNLLL